MNRKPSLLASAAIVALWTSLLISCGGGGGGGVGGASAGGGQFGVSSEVGGVAARVPGAYAFEGAPAVGFSGSEGGGEGGPTSATGSSTSSDSSTTTASGDNGSGVGSGGTGVSSADGSAAVGSVAGLGSVIVNGVRYNNDGAVTLLPDVSTLELGMTVKVTGPVRASNAEGVALTVESAIDIRGPVSSIDASNGIFLVLGTTISTDSSTVWADAPSLAGLSPGSTVQVWGLPGASGTLRATRVQQLNSSAPIISGTVQNLNPGLRTFKVGTLTVDYGAASFAAGLNGATLRNGTIVRVRGTALAGNGSVLVATSVESWYSLPQADGLSLRLEGIVSDFGSLAAFSVLGQSANASAAVITGGPNLLIGNGVKVEVSGTVTSGVLKVSRLKVKHVPGMGGAFSFTLIGTIGAFSSPGDFRVRGQRVDASGPNVRFVNGNTSKLGNGTKVTLSGAQVVNGILIADTVTFDE